MIIFVVAISNSKFGGNFRFDAEAQPKIQDVAPESAPQSKSPEEFTFKCTKEELDKVETALKPPELLYDRKQQK
jgi:hypothetical protein